VMMMTSVDFSDREEHVARQTKTFINTQRQWNSQSVAKDKTSAFRA
jgi:hypothetical protein